MAVVRHEKSKMFGNSKRWPLTKNNDDGNLY